MLEIDIPIWILLMAAGLPTLLAMGVFYKERRKNRSQTAMPCVPPAPEFILRPEGFGVHVHRQLLEQHVDSAFSALSALLEAERAKLNTLMKYSYTGSASGAITEDNSAAYQTQPSEEFETTDTPIGQRISTLMTQGMATEQIARHLGISQTEVLLAQKMNCRRSLSGSIHC